jgi:hypothetical protein
VHGHPVDITFMHGTARHHSVSASPRKRVQASLKSAAFSTITQ